MNNWGRSNFAGAIRPPLLEVMLKKTTPTEIPSQPVCHVSGYAAKFVTQLLKRHECPVCLAAMRNPVQTECGHLFCRGCLEPILDGPNPLCPLDKTTISREEVSIVCFSDVIDSEYNVQTKTSLVTFLNVTMFCAACDRAQSNNLVWKEGRKLCTSSALYLRGCQLVHGSIE